MDVMVKRLTEDAILPTYGSDEAAGMDLYASSTEHIMAGQTIMIGTGIAMAIPKGYVGLLFARSGLACKKGLAPANKVGVIDSDYRGEIKVALHNHNSVMDDKGAYSPEWNTIGINKGDRIAQLVIVPYALANLVEVDDLDDTNRGTGGFGSTGSN